MESSSLTGRQQPDTSAADVIGVGSSTTGRCDGTEAVLDIRLPVNGVESSPCGLRDGSGELAELCDRVYGNGLPISPDQQGCELPPKSSPRNDANERGGFGGKGSGAGARLRLPRSWQAGAFVLPPRWLWGYFRKFRGIGEGLFPAYPSFIVVFWSFIASFIAMQLLRIVHPPGGASALIAVMSPPSLRCHGFFVLTPVLLGVCIMLTVALFVNNIARHTPVLVAASHPRHSRARGLHTPLSVLSHHLCLFQFTYLPTIPHSFHSFHPPLTRYPLYWWRPVILDIPVPEGSTHHSAVTAGEAYHTIQHLHAVHSPRAPRLFPAALPTALSTALSAAAAVPAFKRCTARPRRTLPCATLRATPRATPVQPPVHHGMGHAAGHRNSNSSSSSSAREHGIHVTAGEAYHTIPHIHAVHSPVPHAMPHQPLGLHSPVTLRQLAGCFN
ncbi:unnamed protein product, partial [Closterium sp. NIES-64]